MSALPQAQDAAGQIPADRRLHRGDVERGDAVTLTVDGAPLSAYAGETVATALVAAGRRAFRTTPDGRTHGVFCGIGVCFECLVTVNGAPNQRACMVYVTDGMTVATEGQTPGGADV